MTDIHAYAQTAKNIGVDVVILAGGAATRLAPLGLQCPKSLLPVAKKPIILWQIESLLRAYPTIRRVLVVIRKADQSAFASLLTSSPIPIVLCPENHPHGTGRALLDMACLPDISPIFMAMNGDVLFCPAPASLLQAAQQNGAAMQAIMVPNAHGLGALQINNGLITAMVTAQTHEPAHINAGLYAFKRDVLLNTPYNNQQNVSFEHDIAPWLITTKQLAAIKTTGSFIDIGTPPAYGAAQYFNSADMQRYMPHLQYDDACIKAEPINPAHITAAKQA